MGAIWRPAAPGLPDGRETRGRGCVRRSRVARGAAGRRRDGHEVGAGEPGTASPARGRRPRRGARGRGAVVDCADDPSAATGSPSGARRLADAPPRHGVHLVHISIVGIDDHPLGTTAASCAPRASRRPADRPRCWGDPVPLPRSLFARRLSLGPSPPRSARWPSSPSTPRGRAGRPRAGTAPDGGLPATDVAALRADRRRDRDAAARPPRATARHVVRVAARLTLRPSRSGGRAHPGRGRRPVGALADVVAAWARSGARRANAVAPTATARCPAHRADPASRASDRAHAGPRSAAPGVHAGAGQRAARPSM